MKLYEIFENCLNAPYVTLENCADVAVIQKGIVLSIYFEASDGSVDWQNNFDFPARPYGHFDGCVWFAHRGFVRVWKSVEPYVKAAIESRNIQRIMIAGYSHGAALAVLCHEYAWFHRPDLRERIDGFGFGCPRVVWGIAPKELKARWERFTVVRNIDDIVTHLPPRALGYTHVGKMLKIGTPGKYTAVNAHRPENILRELKSAGV